MGGSSVVGRARKGFAVGTKLTLVACLATALAVIAACLLQGIVLGSPAIVAAIGALVLAIALPLVGLLTRRLIRPLDKLEADTAALADISAKLQESREHQAATAEVLRVISSSKFDLDAVLTRLVQTGIRLCDATRGVIWLQRGGQLFLAAHVGYPDEWVAFAAANPIVPAADSVTASGIAVFTGEVVHVQDMLTDPRFRMLEAHKLGNYRAGLSVPLKRDGEVLGVISLSRTAAELFTSRQVELIEVFADQAVIAIENVRLFDELQARTRELAQSQLRRFLAPQVADLLLASGEQETVLESRRREVTVVFCDLRGFTAFAESAQPEEVMAVLRDYHASLGELIFRFEGTLERFVGDGLLVVFNDPVPMADHPARAVRMALAMRERMHDLSAEWSRHGHKLGFGIGMAEGYATVGPIGFDKRLDYAVIGSIPNLASRLCDAARPGQILVSQRVFVSVEGRVEVEQQADLALKGFKQPVPCYAIQQWRETGEVREPVAVGAEPAAE